MREFLRKCVLSVGLLGCLTAGASGWPGAPLGTPPYPTAPAPRVAQREETIDQSSSADDDYVTNKDAGIRFYVPDYWETERDKDTLWLWPSDEAVDVAVWVAGDMPLAEARKNVSGLLKNYLTDIEVDDDSEAGDENGVPVVWMSGSGICEGEECTWEATLVKADRLMVFLSIGYDDGLGCHSAALEELDESIERATSRD